MNQKLYITQISGLRKKEFAGATEIIVNDFMYGRFHLVGWSKLQLNMVLN